MAGDDWQQDRCRTMIRLLKLNLEGWREVLLPINSLMMWERSYDPGILLGASTVTFLFLWYLEPSVLTTFSILGIIGCLVDYVVPTLSASFFDPNKWTRTNEQKFESICRGLASSCEHIQSFCSFMNYLKKAKPKIYFVIVLTILTLLAWIGNLMNNLLLTYILVSILLLVPGLKHHGILWKYFEQVIQTTCNALGTAKQKKK